jgi:hypothetical protein
VVGCGMAGSRNGHPAPHVGRLCSIPLYL